MSDEYKVGYGKPPKEHQFPKGRSGNPKGRPKKKPPYVDLIEVLDAPVRVRGSSETMSAFEATLRLQARDALAGDLKAITAFLKICDDHRIFAATDPSCERGVVIAPHGVDIEAWLKPDHHRGSKTTSKAAEAGRERAERERKARSQDPTLADLVHKGAFEMHRVTLDGVTRDASTIELVLQRLRQAALEGKSAAIALMRKLIAKHGARAADGQRLGVIVMPPEVSPEEFLRTEIELNKSRRRPEGC